MTTFVFSLEGVAPSPLYDAPGGQTPAPFTRALIQWSSVLNGPAGPWADLEQISLDPVDADAAVPMPRNLTTRLAPAETGWLRVVWSDDDENTQATAPMRMSEPAPTWAPTVQDVADVSQAYTRAPIGGAGASAGRRQGAFDETTNPKASQVGAYITAAIAEVASRVGVPALLLEPYGELARAAAKWHAAVTVEAEHGAQGNGDVESARAWKQSSYVACLNELINQVRPHAFTVPITTRGPDDGFLGFELLP